MELESEYLDHGAAAADITDCIRYRAAPVVFSESDAPARCGLTHDFIACRPRLRAIAEGIVGCRDRAEDVVQDAFVKVATANAATQVAQPVPYLSRIVRNLALDHYRRSAFEMRWFASEDQGIDLPAPTPSPEVELESRQNLRALADKLAELPARTRKAFVLNRIDGMTQREVAEVLRVSPTLVNFMLKDALEHCGSVREALA